MTSKEIDYPPDCQPIPKSSNNNELIKRLKALSDALTEADSNQVVNEPNRYQKLFAHLSDGCFVLNANKDVIIYLACCLANIIRIFSPELPVTDTKKLKEPLLVIIRALKGLAEVKTDHPMFKRYHYLLELVNATEMMNIANEMHEDSELIYKNLIKTILFIPNGNGWKKKGPGKVRRDTSEISDNGPLAPEEGEKQDTQEKVKNWLIQLATKTIWSMDNVMNPVLDALFFYLISPQKANSPDSNEIAYFIVKKSQSHLEPSIHAVLEQSLVNGHLPTEFLMTGQKKAPLYDLIKELHAISRELVSTTFRFLPTLLRSEDETDRLLVTTLVGKMAQSSQSKFGYTADDETWNIYLHRFRDLSVRIREQCAKDSAIILLKHPSVRGQILPCLERLVHDSDESIRLTVLDVVRSVATERLESISESLIVACTEKMKDKKPKVRSEAVKSMLCLFDVVCNDQTGKYTESERESVYIIPQKALTVFSNLSGVPGMEDTRIAIERYFQHYVISYKSPPALKVRVMADLYSRLNNVGICAFNEWVRRSSQLRRLLRELLHIISRENLDKEQKSTAVLDRLDKLVNFFPDQAQLTSALRIFTNLVSKEQSFFELLEYIVSTEYTSAEMVAKAGTLVRKCKDTKEISSNNAHSTALRQFIERCSPLAMDNESAKQLVLLVTGTVQDAQCLNTKAANAMPSQLKLLKLWTDNFAHLFNSDTVTHLIALLDHDELSAVETSLECLKNYVHQSSVRAKLTEYDWYEPLCQKLESLILTDQYGHNRIAKLAFILFIAVRRSQLYAFIDKHLQTFIDRIDIENEACANAFSVLELIYRVDAAKYRTQIMKLVTDKTKIGRNIILSTKTDIGDPETFNANTPMDQQPWPKYARAKVSAMKFVSRTLLNMAGHLEKSPDPSFLREAKAAATLWLEAFTCIIKSGGDLTEETVLSSLERAHLRAAAAACIIKLCHFSAYRYSFDTGSFLYLSRLIYDEDSCVRNHFVVHLRKGLTRKLANDFAGIYTCVNYNLKAEESDLYLRGFIDQCQKLANNGFAARSITAARTKEIDPKHRPSYISEYVIAYAVYILAHNEDLESHEDVATLTVLQECLWTILNGQIAARCDTEVIFQTLNKVKNCGDSWMKSRVEKEEISHEQLEAHNKKIWAIAHLGVHMMVYRAKIQVQGTTEVDVRLSNMFYYSDKRADPSEVYAPDELIDAEMKRHGRIPKAVTVNSKKKNISMNSKSSISEKSRSRKPPAGRPKAKKAKVDIESSSNGEDNDDDDEMEIDDDDLDEIIPEKKNRRKVTDGEEASTSRRSRSDGTSTNGVAKRSTSNGVPKSVSSPKKSTPRRSARSTADTDEDEEVDDDDDIPTTSAVKKSPRKSAKQTNASPNKSSPVKKKTRRDDPDDGNLSTIEVEDDDEDFPVSEEVPAKKAPVLNRLLKKKSGSLLEEAAISPIVKEGKRATRKSGSTLVSSTPMRLSVVAKEKTGATTARANLSRASTAKRTETKKKAAPEPNKPPTRATRQKK